MKKFFLGVCFCILLSTIKVEASWGYKYFDAGGLYAGTKFPQSVATDINSSENPVDIYKLKRGESTSRNILRLIEIGDASINTAARNGRIKKEQMLNVIKLRTTLTKLLLLYFVNYN